MGGYSTSWVYNTGFTPPTQSTEAGWLMKWNIEEQNMDHEITFTSGYGV